MLVCVLVAQFHDSMHSVDACAGLTDADISRSIRQATGPRSPLFVPEGSFDVLARQQIKLLRSHCLAAVDDVLGEMQRLIPACLPQAVLRYANLQARMQQCTYKALQRRERTATEMVNNLLEIELAYLNTSHPDFVGGGTAMRLVAQQLHAAADEQQYRAEQAAPAPAPSPPPPQARSYEQAEASRQQQDQGDPLGATGGGNDTFLNQFFGTGTVSTANPFSSAPSPAPPPPPPPRPPPPPQNPYGAYPSNRGGGLGETISSGLQRMSGQGGPRDRTQANREQLETDIIRSLLVSYYGIVRKNLLDSVPKAIMHFLVNSVRANIQEELVIELYREDDFTEMLKEADDAVRRRQDCVRLVGTLEKAQRVLDELRAMPIEGALLDLQMNS